MSMARFTSEYELQRVVQRCHNILWERHGFDRSPGYGQILPSPVPASTTGTGHAPRRARGL